MRLVTTSMADISADSLTLLRVGELAKRTGKTVRAIHLYEELGLLAPAVRSKGGFRLYPGKAVKRIDWIQKLQDLGFSLTEIKAFLRDWEESDAAPKAMDRVREIFSDKLRETKETIARLERLVGDLHRDAGLHGQLPFVRADPHAGGMRHLRHPRPRRTRAAAGRRDFKMTLKLPIYMDNHATTPVDPRVLEAMLPYFTQDFGNAASRNHGFGWTAEKAVEAAREQVGALIGAAGKEIVWTSGATESDNLAIKGAAEFHKDRGNHIITAQTEHKAVLDTCKRLEKEGFEVTYLPVDKDGRVSAEPVRGGDDRQDDPVVSIMLANNEIGTVNPINEIGAVVQGEGRAVPRRRRAGRGQGAVRRQRRAASTWRRSRRTRCTAPRASARCTCGASRACASPRRSTAAATSAACARAR